jgi:HD-like signal output (HDOD) protein
MNKLAYTVQEELLKAIDNDDLVLPTLPEVALRIRKAAEDQNINIKALGKVIGSDPALSARLIKVVNSPLLRASNEVTGLNTAITRLGIHYSCNLAIGLVIEQIFHARAPAVEQKMHEVWRNSLEVAGISYEICRRFSNLKPDQAALAGLVHQIGVLPILTYAQDCNDLLSDPVCLEHVIEHIHPIIGDRILQVWDFPETLARVPSLYLDLSRQSASLDYADIVQIATLLSQANGSSAHSNLPALRHLRQDAPLLQTDELHAARRMFH